MPYLRQRQRIAANGRVAVRLNPGQRDVLLRSPHIPKDLGHLLHHAPVKKGKLEIRTDRPTLAAMIAAVVAAPVSDRDTQRALDTFVRYLEGLEDRFADSQTGEV